MLGKRDPLMTSPWSCCVGNAISKLNLKASLPLIGTDFNIKLISDSVFIDKKIRFRVTPKSNIALKILRNQIGFVLADQFRGKTLSESQIVWHEVALLALAKSKLPQERCDVVIH